MKALRLRDRLLLATVIVFIAFFLSSVSLFYFGQKRLVVQEMDRLLDNEVLTMSNLLNIDSEGSLDFEFSPQFIPQYTNQRLGSFFRFIDLSNNRVVQENPGAPLANCDLEHPFTFESFADKTYRKRSYRFNPGLESAEDPPAHFISPSVCLVLGIDEAPYRKLLTDTIIETLPYGVIVFVLALLLLSALIRKLTADLSALLTSLSNMDFDKTRSLPELPSVHTVEVREIVGRLSLLHHQVNRSYEEMLLFIARASHQLKTPAAAAQATIEVLTRKDRSKEELLAGISDIAICITQMNRLTQKLISSSRLSFDPIVTLQAVDLADFFADQIRMFQNQAALKDLDMHVTGPQAQVLADSYLLTEIFANLFENAISHSPRSGVIRISWAPDHDHFRIQVADQGPGFSASLQDSLFQPFVRGDERAEGGSGLGLSIALKATQAIGGSLELLRSGPQGSVLEVRLRGIQKEI